MIPESARRKFLLILLTTCFSLVSAEAGLRLFFKITHRDIKAFDANVSLYRPHPFLGYALVPGYLRNHVNQTIKVNNWGLRGNDFTVNKAPGVYRIIILGGSAAFGHGLREEETISFQLQSLFNRLTPENKVEVINAGVDGYSTFHSVNYVSSRLLDFSPDLLISYHVWNDLKYWGRISPENEFAIYGGAEIRPKDSFLQMLLRKSYLLIAGEAAQRVMVDILKCGASNQSENTNGNAKDSDAVNFAYGAKVFKRNLCNLIAIARSNDAHVLLINQLTLIKPEMTKDEKGKVDWFEQEETLVENWRQANAILKDLAAERGALYLDLNQQVRSDLSLLSDHVHLTPAGAGVVAKEIFNYLQTHVFMRARKAK